METLKTIWRGFSGMAVLAALILTTIGGTGYLIYDQHYLFAVALVVVICFAAKPMWKYIQQKLML